ncbi:hypothetical protein B566_EDAN004545 [Ephemera danica]|nr:hypothetical protein B566_EDAN004545 [Ephemera danica]
MGDSDDEYDRKRRDKFRGERTEYRGGEGRREERRSGTMGSSAPRDDWSESAPPPRKMDKGYPEYDPYEAKRLKERANSFQSYQGTRSSESWGGGGGSGGGRNRVATSYPDYRQSSGPPGRSSSGNGSRDRYSPPSRSHELSQPIKRARTDWGEERRYMPEPSYGGGGGGYTNNPWGPPPPEGHYGHPGGPYGGHGSSRDVDMGQTQPAMMSFKSFLQTQDDNISDEEAINKYNEYKLEFKRQQLNDFFVNHKDEEWFKIKYHPEDSVKRKDEQMTALKNRVSVFLEFLDKERFSSVTVDADQSEALVKLLDSVVIRLEGGTEFDLEVLEQAVNQVVASQQQQQQAQQSEPPVNPRNKELLIKAEEGSFTPPPRSDSTEESGVEKVVEKAESPESHTPPPVSEDKEGEGEEEESKDEPVEGEKEEEMETETAKPEVIEPAVEKPVQLAGKKRKREYDFESGSDSADDMDDEPQREESEDRAKSSLENGDKSVKHRDSDDEDGKSEHDGTEKKEREEGSVDTSREEGEAGADGQLEKPKQEEKEETPEPEEPKPRALHKTASIFLRNLAPTITKQEVEAMCKRYPGFLRVAIADPQPERRWFRRGWVTFERHVNIKEICWNLNNIRLGAIVNRDLSRRVRTVNGITSHKQVVRHDIKVAARIVQNLDEKVGLWTEPGQKSTQSDIPSFGLVSKNPVLKNITDYLIEEASAEEEELLGQASSVDAASAEGTESGEQAAQASGGSTVERDDTLLQVLDRLLFYLRIVHSVDYYNHCDFGLVSKNPVLKNITDYLIEEASAEEEELLGQASSVDAASAEGTESGEQAAQASGGSTVERDDTLLQVLDRLLFYLRIVHSVDYYNHCEYPNEDEMPNRCGDPARDHRLLHYPATKLIEEDLHKLGAKDPEAEVEKFVVANTQELAKDKWLCPLSGKKFKGADFVRKHIFNKHGEKVDEVKKEVEYFNNYLRDPKRPQLPEHPGNRSQKRDGPPERDGYNSGGGGYMPQYGGGYNNYGSGGGGGMNSRGYNNYTSGYGGGGPTYNREPYHREPYSRPHRGGHYGNRGNRFPSSTPFEPMAAGSGGETRRIIGYQDLDFNEDKEFF